MIEQLEVNNTCFTFYNAVVREIGDTWCFILIMILIHTEPKITSGGSKYQNGMEGWVSR